MNSVKFDRMAHNPAWDTICDSLPKSLVQEVARKTIISENGLKASLFRYPEQAELDEIDTV